jgi:carbon storage regulator
MLILTRKDGESIRIGSDVIVKVSQISGGRVKLAIDAPRDVTIRRNELPERAETPTEWEPCEREISRAARRPPLVAGC